MRLMLLLFSLVLLNTIDIQAQVLEKEKSNIIGLEYIYISEIPQFNAIYYKDLSSKKINEESSINLSTFAGIGYQTTSFGNYNQPFITAGLSPGLKLYAYHKIELGVQYSKAEVINTTSTRKSRVRLRAGYAYEDTILIFRIFVNPFISDIFKSDKLHTGFGFGIRF